MSSHPEPSPESALIGGFSAALVEVTARTLHLPSCGPRARLICGLPGARTLPGEEGEWDQPGRQACRVGCSPDVAEGPDEGQSCPASCAPRQWGWARRPPGPGTSSGALLAPPPMPRWGTRLPVDKLVSLSWAERAPSCAHWQDSKGFEE